jgi:hypothetical protein
MILRETEKQARTAVLWAKYIGAKIASRWINYLIVPNRW